MNTFEFTPTGVCAQKIYFGIDDEGKLHPSYKGTESTC